jgi:hypothetical protein
LAYSWP